MPSHTWVLNQRSCKFKLSYNARKRGGGRGCNPASGSNPQPCGQSNARGRGEALGRSHLPEAGIQLALTMGPREGSETGPLGAVRLGSQQRTEPSPGGTRQVVVAGTLPREPSPLMPREPSPLMPRGRTATERVAATAERRGCKQGESYEKTCPSTQSSRRRC